MKLVQPGQGQEFTRRRISIEELYRPGEDHGRIDEVLASLIDARLVRKCEGDGETPAQLEVIHEALIRNWSTLVEWLEDASYALRQRAKLRVAAEGWQQGGRSSAFLHRGDQLAETEG